MRRRLSVLSAAAAMIVMPVAAAAFVLMLSAGPAAAQQAGEGEDDPALRRCGAVFDGCMSRCAVAYPEDPAAEAGCQAACAADRAVCEAKTGYEQAKPWVEEQFRGLQRFLEGFAERGRPAPPRAEPDPEAAPPGDGAPPEDTRPEAEEEPRYKDI